MTELSRREFRQACRQVNNNDEPLTMYLFMSVISCCGKPVNFKQISRMWPERREHITLDEAYSLYVRYDAKEIPQKFTSEELEEYEGLKSADFIDYIINLTKFDNLQDLLVKEMQKFTLDNGDVDISELLKEMEIIKKEIITAITSSSAEPPSPLKKLKQEYEPIEKTTGFRGMLIVSPPLITTTYIIKVPEKCTCTIELKLAVNSNSRLLNGIHPFADDMFLLILDKDKKFVGVTRNKTDEGFITDEIAVENDFSMIAMSLGTTKCIKTKRGTDEKLIIDGKVTKEFKITLMNIFDMFDLDGDNLLNIDEYNAYCLASGDSSISETEWKKIKEIVEFRDERMTLRGFLEFHQMEIFNGDKSSLDDCWASLLQMGFDENLKIVNCTPFTIDMKCETPPLILPKLEQVNKELRNKIIGEFYRLGVVDRDCELEPRTFFTNYFGLTIVDRIRALDNAGYRVEILKEKNIKWHFISGQENIKPFTYESELLLICSWVATSVDYEVDYKIVREDGT